MKVTYYNREDILRVQFNSGVIEFSERLHTGLVIDFNHQGKIVALELSPASEFLGIIEPDRFLECTIIPGESVNDGPHEELSYYNTHPTVHP